VRPEDAQRDNPISSWTVQDHFAAVYVKTGGNSRSDLITPARHLALTIYRIAISYNDSLPP
jgi:hypothetical protein